MYMYIYIYDLCIHIYIYIYILFYSNSNVNIMIHTSAIIRVVCAAIQASTSRLQAPVFACLRGSIADTSL